MTDRPILEAPPTQAALTELAALVPLSIDSETLIAHMHDASRAVADGAPAAVARPTTTRQVSDALAWATAHRVPVSIRGGGSGLSGGAVSYDGGLVISLLAFDGIEIDSANLLATVGAGVVTARLDAAAAEQGLMYAPDPVSSDSSTIGGNIATNAGGPRCLSHGVTADAVAALEVVLADGRIVRTGSRTVKNSTGLDLTSLFVGSEGALGVVTEATVRLVPRPDGERVPFAAVFPALEGAGDAVIAILGELARPESLELMDANTLALVATHFPDERLPVGAATLVGEYVGDGARMRAERLVSLCSRYGAETMLDEQAETLLRTRMRVNPALNATGLTTSCDVAVPISRLTRMLQHIDEHSRRFGLRVNAFAHAGDGNFHPAVVVPHGDPATLVRAEQLLDAITESALELGGVVSGEHGIGSLKHHHLEHQFDEQTLLLQRELKRFLDPAGILSPNRAI